MMRALLRGTLLGLALTVALYCAQVLSPMSMLDGLGGAGSNVRPPAVEYPVGPLQQQISQNAKIKALCVQILAGKLHVKSHQGEVRAVRQCKRDGW